MRSILLIYLMITIVSGFAQVGQPYTLDNYNLNLQVSQVVQTTLVPDSSGLNKEEIKTFKFDIEGRQIETINHRLDEYRVVDKYEINKYGNLSKLSIIDESMTMEVLFFYDDQQRPISTKENETDHGDEYYSRHMSYTEITYEENMIETKYYHGTSEIYNHSKVYKNEKGLDTLTQNYRGSKVQGYATIAYDEQDRPIKYQIFEEDSLLHTVEISHSDNSVRSIWIDPLGPIFNIEEEKYDEHGNTVNRYLNDKVSETEYEFKYEYVYDENGNWTEKKTYENGVLKSVKRRVYTYF